MSRELNRSWFDLERQRLAQGWTGTNSKRASQFVNGVYPTHLVRGQGCHVWDVDKNRYVDFIGALGPITLGYGNRRVDEAVIRQVRDGPIFSLPHPLEVQVAEKICEMIPGCEQVRFLKTGNEATLAAVRIARTYQRLKLNAISVVSEGYHGHGDLWTSLTPPAFGIEDEHAIWPLSEKDTTGCIFITEPVALDASEERRKKLGENMLRAGVVIFDEIVTGGRVPKYTVANWWNMKPDLICLGKGLANGYPISIVGGSKGIMSCGDYFVSSTFSGDCIGLAACLATLQELEQRNMEDLAFYGSRFISNFNKLTGDLGPRLDGYGTRGMLNVTEPNTALLMQECCKSGILFGKAFYYNFAHLESQVEEYVLNIVSDVVGRIKRGEVKLEGEAPSETFKR